MDVRLPAPAAPRAHPSVFEHFTGWFRLRGRPAAKGHPAAQDHVAAQLDLGDESPRQVVKVPKARQHVHVKVSEHRRGQRAPYARAELRGE